MRTIIFLLALQLSAATLVAQEGEAIGEHRQTRVLTDGLRLPIRVEQHANESRAPILVDTSQPLIARGQEPQIANVPQSIVEEDVSAEPAAATNNGTSGLTPLKRPSKQRFGDKLSPNSGSGSRGNSLSTVMAALGIVLAVFFGMVWLSKRAMPKSQSGLPKDVVEVFGRTQLHGRQFAHLVRVGNKLLLVSISPNGLETLTEITDPLEVDRISGLCRQGNSGSISESFRSVLSQLGQEPTAAGFVDSASSDPGSSNGRRGRHVA